ncbi:MULTISPECIES: ABC transporter permease [Pseudomonas]|uniref:Arginine ABC transporter permease protein ArtM n=1 Tax=Pseudomonas putida TaxID=303 RepID=A0A2S3WCW6_PSEPU|nr:ABC transporter permease subunit [Pseudomonas putida]POF88807.1 ABC transporter permease [Pseudomonas putida]
MDFAFLLECFKRLLAGIPLTLALSLFSCAIGLVLASVICAMRLSRKVWLDYPARSFVAVFRGTPLLVQLFVIYYGLSQFAWLRESFAWPYLREPFWCVLAALALNTAAYSSEILRGGINSVQQGQIESAHSVGLRKDQIWRYVIIPQAWRQMLPAYGNEIILQIKSTSLASIVTLMEVTGIAAKLVSQSYRPIEVFVCAGALYLLLNFIVTRVVILMESRLTRGVRR